MQYIPNQPKVEVIGLIGQELVFEHKYAGGMRHMR